MEHTKKVWNKAKIKHSVVDLIFYIFLGFTALTCLLPFVHILSKSISNEAFVVANKIILLPKGINVNAYQKIFQDASILRSLYVSVVVTAAFTLVGMFLTICAAYALSRPNLKGRRVMTFLCMFTMYFAGGMIPDYLLMNNLNMLDTWWCMILPLAFSAYNLLIMKNFFANSIPDSLVESAVIDGA